jgi:acyl dehydratase
MSPADTNTPDRLGPLDVGLVREIVKGPITRTQLALFAGASGDHNPIHLDDEAARKGGLPGVIAHGMLNMAFFGDLLLAFAPLQRLRLFEARFLSPSVPGDVITCRGEVTAIQDADGGPIAVVALRGTNAAGLKVIEGLAHIAVASR